MAHDADHKTGDVANEVFETSSCVVQPGSIKLADLWGREVLIRLTCVAKDAVVFGDLSTASVTIHNLLVSANPEMSSVLLKKSL